MRCSKCGSDNRTGKRFCGDCGAPLENRCPKCGADNPSGKRFCGDCGGALSAKNANAQSPASCGNAPDLPVTAEQPQRALYAALRLQEASGGIRRNWSPTAARRWRRVGINTGEVVARTL